MHLKKNRHAHREGLRGGFGKPETKDGDPPFLFPTARSLWHCDLIGLLVQTHGIDASGQRYCAAADDGPPVVHHAGDTVNRQQAGLRRFYI